MTKEEAISRLEQGAPFSEVFNKSWEEALDMALSALSEDGEYVKKGDAISKILIEFTERESNGKVMCACADVKQTCADILDGLPSYSFPDSAEINGDLISRQAVNALVDELARAISDERCFTPRGRSTGEIMSDILNLPSVFAEEAYPNIKEKLHKAVDMAESEDKE